MAVGTQADHRVAEGQYPSFDQGAREMTPPSAVTLDRPAAAPSVAPPGKPSAAPPASRVGLIVRLLITALVVVLYYAYRTQAVHWLERAWTKLTGSAVQQATM